MHWIDVSRKKNPFEIRIVIGKGKKSYETPFNLYSKISMFISVLIITSPLNSPETLALLKRLSIYNQSKVLIIDTIGNIFNNPNKFYETINRNKGKWLTSNLLVLTTLTAKLRRFLNATLPTEFHNIYYGKMNGNASIAGVSVDFSTANEGVVIKLLEERLSGHDQRNVDISDGSILVHFNETELNLIASVLEKLFNGTCRTIHTKSMSNAVVSSFDAHNNTNNMEKLENTSRADGGNKPLELCATNNNSLSKCELFLHERATLLANSTRSPDIKKLLCEQIQLWRLGNPQHQFVQNNKSNSVPSILNRNVNNLGKNRTATAEQEFQIRAAATATTTTTTAVESNVNRNSDATSSEFVNSISNQIDAKFSGYFPFFDFIVTKLALSYNLTVNYNNHSSSFVNAASNDTVSTMAGDTFDFCVLVLRSNQASAGDYNVSNNNDTSYNFGWNIFLDRNHPPTPFVWRPVLILEQSELHQNIFVTHPLLSFGYHSWFFDNTHKFWTCGLLCWILAGIVILLLVCILVASITFGLAIR